MFNKETLEFIGFMSELVFWIILFISFVLIFSLGFAYVALFVFLPLGVVITIYKFVKYKIIGGVDE